MKHFYLFLVLHIVACVKGQEDVDLWGNESELSALESYVKNLVEKEVKAQMKELKISPKLQDETIDALLSQIQNEREHRKELETRLRFLEEQRKTAEKDIEVKETVLSESKTRQPYVSTPTTSENNTHHTRYDDRKATGIKRLLIGQDTNAHNEAAFYAYMSHGITSPSAGHVLVFDVVKTNVGAGYNHHDGIFTAPSHGPYVFSWTVVSWYRSWVYSELMVNSSTYGKIITNSQDIDDEHVGSGTVVAVLNPGDVVYVRVANSGGSLASTDLIYTSFAGWKLN